MLTEGGRITSASFETDSGTAGSLHISELSKLDVELVRDYLATRGMDDESIRWKYFDADFNAGRDRGFAAVRDGKVVGFIGLIPFRVCVGGDVVETAWTCDWSVKESEPNASVGLSLLKNATQSHPQIFHTGGNRITRRIFSRLATYFDGEAVCEYRLRLRLSSQIDRVAARVPAFAAARGSALGRVALHPLRYGSKGRSLEVTAGVGPDFVGALARQERSTALYPMYDAGDVQWNIARCPTLECYSCQSEEGAAGLAWRSRTPSREWRMALAAPPEGFAGLPDVVQSLVRAAYELDADVVRVRVSAADAWPRSLLPRMGFRASGQLPYFAFWAKPSPEAGVAMSGLSFLDVDEASIWR